MAESHQKLLFRIGREAKKMANYSDESLKAVLGSLVNWDYVHPEDIPNIDLYMDQVTKFLEDELADMRRDEKEKIMTKTMINNYAKAKVLPSPVNKKYSRDHVLTLIFIYYMKNFMSLSDISEVLGPITDKYIGGESSLKFYNVYEELITMEHPQAKSLIADVIHKYRDSRGCFSELPDDISEKDAEELKDFMFVCMLCFDVFVKQKMIQKFIDTSMEKKKAESTKEE